MGEDRPWPSRVASPTHATTPLLSATDIPHVLEQVTWSLQLLVLRGDSRAMVLGWEQLERVSQGHGAACEANTQVPHPTINAHA